MKADYDNTMKTPFIVIVSALLFTCALYAEAPTYTIKRGDTLYSISKKYNIRLESLKSYNNIDDTAILYPGMKILIPGGYTVKKGDTLYGIAKEHDTTINELLSLNNMNKDTLLKEGQFLHVPVADKVAENSTKTGESSGKEPEDKSVEAPAAAEAPVRADADANLLWPHTGSRTELTGKLKGIQIAGAPGDNVISVSGGTVVWASEYGYFKKLVLVEGVDGLVYGYGGNEVTNVKVGDYVDTGSIIGILGGGAGSSDAYFFIYKDGKPVDPLKDPRV